jgi:hypothetical protein
MILCFILGLLVGAVGVTFVALSWLARGSDE